MSGGHSSSRCAGLSLSRPLPLPSTGSRRAGSVVVAHGLSCFVARGILPDQGSNPRLLHRQADSQPLRHQGSPLSFLICIYINFYFHLCFKTVFGVISGTRAFLCESGILILFLLLPLLFFLCYPPHHSRCLRTPLQQSLVSFHHTPTLASFLTNTSWQYLAYTTFYYIQLFSCLFSVISLQASFCIFRIWDASFLKWWMKLWESC